MDNSKHSIDSLNHRFVEISGILEKSNKTYRDYLDAVNHLLRDCIEFGTIPFSSMARVAFISNSMLKSLSTVGLLKDNEILSIMNSIKTPLSELRDDITLLSEKKLGSLAKTFLKNKYNF